MDQVLEHINNPLKVIEELYRIAKKDCKITISVPYYRSMYAFIDPAHVNFFGYFWFCYFDPEHRFYQKYRYSKATFHIDKIIFNRENGHGYFQNVLSKFANKRPGFYESRLSHLFPLDSLTY